MKISRILPQSPRILKMDTEFAPAARPGASTFGRIPGLVTSQDRVSISSEGRNLMKDFKNTAKTLPLDIGSLDLNIQPEILADDMSAGKSEGFELMVGYA